MNTSSPHRTLPLYTGIVIVLALGCAETITLTSTDAPTAVGDDRTDGGNTPSTSPHETPDASATTDRVETPPSFCDPSPCPGRVCCETFRACFPPGTACPGDPPGTGPYACRDNTDCRAEEYCARPGCTTVGICAPRPTGCAAHLPVCGCDGVVYPDLCTAVAEGATVRREGACLTW